MAAPIVRPKQEWRDPDGTHWVVLHIDGETGHPAAFRWKEIDGGGARADAGGAARLAPACLGRSGVRVCRGDGWWLGRKAGAGAAVGPTCTSWISGVVRMGSGFDEAQVSRCSTKA